MSTPNFSKKTDGLGTPGQGSATPFPRKPKLGSSRARKKEIPEVVGPAP